MWKPMAIVAVPVLLGAISLIVLSGLGCNYNPEAGMDKVKTQVPGLATKPQETPTPDPYTILSNDPYAPLANLPAGYKATVTFEVKPRQPWQDEDFVITRYAFDYNGQGPKGVGLGPTPGPERQDDFVAYRKAAFSDLPCQWRYTANVWCHKELLPRSTYTTQTIEGKTITGSK